jgi:hypothetical protein
VHPFSSLLPLTFCAEESDDDMCVIPGKVVPALTLFAGASVSSTKLTRQCHLGFQSHDCNTTDLVRRIPTV